MFYFLVVKVGNYTFFHPDFVKINYTEVMKLLSLDDFMNIYL